MDITGKLSEIESSLSRFIPEQRSRLLEIEQKLVAPRGGNGGGGYDDGDVGSRVINSEEFKRFAMTPNMGKSGRIEVGTFERKTNLLNAVGLNQPLVPPYYRPGIVSPGQQPLRVRDLLPSTPIASNMVTWAKETSRTNAAAPQSAEGELKAESALGFTLNYSPVQTLAHFIPISKQLLDDAPAIQGYVNTRMLYFLKLAEEQQLLNGDGTGTNLSGLMTNATPMDTTLVSPSTDSYIDVLAEAILQCSKSFLPPTESSCIRKTGPSSSAPRQ